MPLAASADLGVSKTRAAGFADPKFVGDTDGFLIHLTNSFNTGDITSVSFTDTMPAGFRVAGDGVVSTECRDGTGAVRPFQGSLVAPLGSNTITLSGGVIPPVNGGTEAGYCDIVVQVTSLSGNGTNLLPAGSVTGMHAGNPVSNADPAQQSLNFNSLAAPRISKSFSPNSIVKADQATRLSITITNNASQPLPLNTASDATPFAIQDTLPAGMRVAPVTSANPDGPGVQINCGANPPMFTPAAGDTQVRAVGGIIAPNSTCTLSVMVVADGSDSAYSTTVSNVINRTTDFANRRGLVPQSNASANLTVTAPLRVSKSFNPGTVAKGQQATLRITLTNASPLSSMALGSFTDVIDGGAGLLTITSQPTANCTGGSSLTGLGGVGTSSLQMSGGTLAPSSNCVINVPYTADLAVAGVPQSFTNTIAPGDVNVISPTDVVSQGVSASVNVVDQFLVEKTSSPDVAAPGNPVRFTVITRNYSTSPQTGVALTDNLPNGMRLLGSPAPALSGGCSGLSVGGTASNPVFTSDMPAGSNGSPANCTLTFWAMVPANAPAGAIVNEIPPGGVCAPGNICNHRSTSAEFGVSSSALTVEKSFDASTKPEGTPATITIELVNLSAQPLTGVSLTDSLPTGSNGTPMLVASPNNASSTCGGTITAVPGSNQVILTGATVPARAGGGLDDAGRCRLRVNVSGAAGQYDNRVSASGTQTFADGTTGTLTSPEAVATVNFLSALSGSKSFTPNRVQPGGRSTVTLTLSNSQAGVLNDVAITDNLPAGMTVANPANAYSTCAGSPVIAAAPGAALVSLSGAQLAGNRSCALLFDVTATGGSNWLNTIAPGQLTAAGGVQNVSPFGATLQNASGGAVTVGVNHATASVAAPGAVTQLTLTLFNSGGLDLTNLSLGNFFTDTGLADGSPTGERIASVPNAVTNCRGGVVGAAANASAFTLHGVNLPAGETCSVTVDVTMVTTGTVTATVPTSAITTDQGVSNSSPASSSLQTSTGLGVTKQFSPGVVAPNERSRLRITFYNPTTEPINDLALTDSYPAGLVNASPANALTTCQGSVTTAAGQVTISGGSIAAGSSSAPASCYVEVDVLSATQGDYPNAIAAGSISATAGGTPISNNEPTSDTLRVKAPIVVHKAIATRTLDAGNPVGFVTGTANGNAGTPYTLSIRLDNPNNGPLSGLAYLDSLPDGLVVAPVPAIANSCGGSVSAMPSATSVRLAGGSLAANGNCVVSVAVLSNIAGSYTNTIPAGGVTSFEGVSNSEPTRARLVISSPPTVTKQFAPAVIAQNGISRLTIYVNNPNATAMTLSAALTDNLPDAPGQVRVATTPNRGGTCPAGNVTATAGATSVRLASGTQVPAGGCTIEVDVTADTAGEHTNVIPAGALRTDLGDNPEPAYAPLTVSTQGYISGRVYRDNNQDGVFQAGSDTPLGGVAIELRSGGSCASGTPVTGINGLLNPINTDAAGNYLFAGLPAGSYSVCQANQPAGTLNALPVAGNITPSNGSSGTPGSAGNASETSSQIEGIVLNGDGAGGEISGSQRNDFPEVAPASISGSVFIDQNNDGVRQGGDSGLAGVVINLSGSDWQNRPVSATTTTDASGSYRFSGLQPGTYTVTEPTQPAGTANGLTVAGNSAGAAPGVTVPGALPSAITGITLTSGYTSEQNNFAEIVSGRSIHGHVYLDRDRSGAPDATDTPLGGQLITLTGTDINGNAVSQTATTGSDGNFSFVGLPPGQYSLSQPEVPGLLPGVTTPGSAGGTASEPTGNSVIAAIDLSTASLSVDNWFGEFPVAPSVTKQFAPSVIPQNGISRLTITINNPNAWSMTLSSAMSDDLPSVPAQLVVAAAPNIGGTCPSARVDAVAGSDVVRLQSGTQVPAGGCTIEVDVTGSAAGTYGNTIVAGALQTDLGGNAQPADASLFVSVQGTIGGRVYLDGDLSDGAYQAGIDSGLPGVALELRDGATCGGSLISGITALVNPVQTDAQGSYSFTGLPAGTYSVCQPVQPTDTLNAGPRPGTIVPVNGSGGSGGTAANPEAGSPSSLIAGIVLGANGDGEVSSSVDNDFPEVQPASISGSVFLDQNNDGLRQGGDGGLTGVAVVLEGSDWLGRPVSLSTQTSADGSYSFAGLAPGSYRVLEPTQPAGTANGITTPGSTGGNASDVTTLPSAIGDVVLVPGGASVDNNFAEIASDRRISGQVFHDRNADGVPDGEDAGLEGQTIELSGTDVHGNPVRFSTVTEADGSFSFIDLPMGTYRLTQPEQPQNLLNGLTTAGSAGGTATAQEVVPSVIQGIDLVANAQSVDNWFAEVSIPGLSGTVWVDGNHDRVLDPGETRLPGWTVELLRDDVVVGTTESDANGAYAFANLTPGSGYEVRFRHPETGTLFGRPVPNEQGTAHTPGTAGPGNPAGADNSDGTLKNLTIMAGHNVIEQSLPIDPAGVVYDALSRQPVRGAVVSISGPAGFDAAQVLGGSLQQTTGSDGLYQFILAPTAPAGTYTLSVTAPAGYVQGPSGMIPACANTLTVTGIPDPALVQTGNQAPTEDVTLHDPATCPVSSAGLAAGVGSTQYYYSFVLAAGSADLVNNHIPLDPILGGAIVMTKNTPKVNVTRGELVPYVLTARNTLSTTLAGIAIEDQVPPGFKYVRNSAQVDGVPIEPQVEGRRLRWPDRSLTGGQVVTVKLLLVVGSGVGFNEYVNQAWALNLLANARVSNVATASVRVVADPTFDCSDLIGKVFDDQNRNGYQDDGEPGIPGVRLATPRGWLVTTDEHGRYHIACADVPSEMRGSNFIVKVDERSLPSGYRVITENPRVVRMTQGRLVKANFGASIHRVVRLDLGSDAFDANNALTAPYRSRLDEVLKLLYAEPSILRIAYRMPVDGAVSDARARVSHVKDWIREHWEPHDCCYDLQLEEEIVPATDSVEVIR